MPVKLSIKSSKTANPRFVEFDAPSISIGRSSRCDLRLPFPAVSGHHLTLFRENDRGYQIRDEGSTNGTRLNGAPMPRGEAQPLPAGAQIEIVDLRIEIDTNAPAGEGVPLAQTGTLVRMMLCETLLDTEVDQAHIRVLKGPAAGSTMRLTEGFESGRIADERSADLFMPNLAAPLAVNRDGDGFTLSFIEADAAALSAVNGQVIINDQPLDGIHRLVSGDEIQIGRNQLRFVDPLEDLLIKLDGAHPSRKNGGGNDAAGTPRAARATIDAAQLQGAAISLNPSDEPDPAPRAQDAPDPQKPPRSWNAIELLLIVASLLLVGAVAYVFLVIFG
jgi:pSer/pThr/pTyr-binding forkhead associated (FHA) protein